jgi:xylulokinase
MLTKENLILSLDLGTSNIKGAIFNESGKQLAIESIEYYLKTPAENIVENDVTEYWDKVKKILHKLSIKLHDRIRSVNAIVTSSQGETLVPVDEHMEPLRDAIVWIDMRSTTEAKEILGRFDLNEMYKKTGYPEVDPSWPATRILWLKKNEPDIFSKTCKFLLLHDYILYKLSGDIVGEATTYNSSYYYDIIKLEYLHDVLDFIGTSEEKLPEVVKSGTVIGNITKEVAEATGLEPGTRVIAGALDQVCGAVGAGNISEGISTETTGSAFAMVVSTDKPVIDYKYKLPCILHAVPGKYGLMPYSSTGGMVLKWFKDNFCKEESKEALRLGQSVFKLLDKQAQAIKPGCEGLTMLPFLTGALFPEYDPLAKAVFFGIGINHNKAHFIRSILESLAFMMKNDIEAINKIGISVKKVISLGGGATSDLWSQIKADVCNVNIEIPSYTEAALLGAAIIGGISLGFYDDYSEACKKIVKIKKVFVPDKSNELIYRNNFKKYKELYKRLKGFF